jgi:hypothetical protein
MCEADFTCDEGAIMAYNCFRDRERQEETLENRIARQREEIRRLLSRLHDVTRSRDYWESEAKRIGKQLAEVIEQNGKKGGL